MELKKICDKVYDTVTANGCREMEEEKFFQGVCDILKIISKNLTIPIVTNPVKLNATEPFTKEEAEIMDLLVRAHNKFTELNKTHEMETTEWVGALHKLQDLLGARVLRRN